MELKLYDPFLFMMFNYPKATEPLGENSFLFTTKYTGSGSWSSFDGPWKVKS